MLTPAQQKIRQELEELQVNGLHREKQDQTLPSKKRRFTNWSFYLIGILLLTIICSVVKFSNHPLDDSITYLTKVQAYNSQSDALLISFIHQSGTVEEMQQAAAKQNQLLQNTIKLKAPADFKEHQQDFIEVINQRTNILTSLAGSNKVNLIELTVKEELAKESFERALQKEKIKYHLQKDGTIEFWINTRSFRY
jgi:hypothetical protein